MPRPATYTTETAQQICNTIATSATGLVDVCKNEALPDYATIMQWLADDDKKEFRQNYRRAREAQADLLVDQMIAITDEIPAGDIDSPTVALIKLRVETRQWKAAKLAPHKYGSKPLTAGEENDQEERKGNFIIWNGQKIPV